MATKIIRCIDCGKNFGWDPSMHKLCDACVSERERDGVPVNNVPRTQNRGKRLVWSSNPALIDPNHPSQLRFDR